MVKMLRTFVKGEKVLLTPEQAALPANSMIPGVIFEQLPEENKTLVVIKNRGTHRINADSLVEIA